MEGEIYVMPMERTYARLHVLNLLLKWDNAGDKVEKYNFEYPIELEDIINQTEDVWQLLHDREILSEENYEIMLKDYI